jgi:hypothetical protein
MLPKLIITFPDAHTKHLFLQTLVELQSINVDPASIKGSVETAETLHVNYVNEIVQAQHE